MIRRYGALGSIVLLGCGQLVPVTPDGVQDAGAANTAVTARTAGVRDPLPVMHSSVSYANLERALYVAVVRSVRLRREQTLTVELVDAEAEYAHDRLAISLVARATLRNVEGNAFVAQTQVLCREGAVVAPEAGGRVVWECMASLGRDLGGWLEGVNKDANTKE